MNSLISRRTLVILTTLSMYASVAFAETVQGSVLKTGAASLEVRVYDAQGRPYPNALRVKTDSRTKFNGVFSSSGLRLKDPVQVAVSQQKDGTWHADSVTKLAKSQTVVPASSAPPSNALVDALKSPTGQNVTRGAVSGALTGAVASYASGGKAGKGALVGAGVGAAAGLLQGWLSQPASQPSSSTDVRYDDRSSQS